MRRLAVGGVLLVALLLIGAGVASVVLAGVPWGWLRVDTLPLAAALVALGMLMAAAALVWFDDRRWTDVLVLSVALVVVSAAAAGTWWIGPWTLPLLGTEESRIAGAALLATPGGLTVISAWLARLLRVADTHTGISDFYEHAIGSRRVRRDEAQEAVVAHLERLSDAVMRFERARRMPWGFLRRPPRGVYLWGPVGRGKSFLMDGFFDVLPSRNKRRYHFHELLADIRRQLHAASGRRNPFRVIAAEIAPRAAVVFIDELQINDVDNARVFAALLREFRRNRNTVCLTSNQPPGDLFGDSGAARERFGKVLAQLEAQMDVMALDRGQDYRELKLTAHDLYQFPISAATEAGMQRVFDMLIEGPVQGEPIKINGRRFSARAHGAGVAWFDFEELCRRPRSYVDFLELVRDYPNLMISNVPAFSEDDEDAARRFAWLVELVYDNRKRLIVSACARPSELFPARLSSHGDVADFGKIASRLMEMQSSEYDYSLASETQ